MKIFIASQPELHQEIADWVAARIAHVDGFEHMTTIGVMSEEGKPLGAVVYHDFRDLGIQLSCAADSCRWLSKTVLASIFAYPFKQLGCRRVTAMTPAGNQHTRQFLERVGFQQEGVMRQGFENDDCVVYGMLRAECKWIERDHHGQEQA